MACTCDDDPIHFSLPSALRAVDPDGAEARSICPRCLDLGVVSPDEVHTPPEFSRIVSEFPEGEPGAAIALAVGLLVESVAMHREPVAALFEWAADAGEDPWIVIERLAVSPTVTPDADLDRIYRQLDQLIG